MSTGNTVLKAEVREGTGSRSSRKARASGRTPANIYGHGEGNQALSLEAHALQLALDTPAQVFTLDIAGAEQPCLVKEVQYDTFGQVILHVDFARIDLSEQVEVEVALRPVGNAAGIADGGTLTIQHNTLMVRCRADAIPDDLEVDVTELAMGSSIHAGEIKLPAGVVLDEAKQNPGTPMITVLAPRVIEVEEEEEGETPVDGEAGTGDAPEADGDAPAEGDKKEE